MPVTKTAKLTGIDARIAKLRALAEHPNTPVHEADVARRALARALAKMSTTTHPSVDQFVDMRAYGSKYAATQGMTTQDIVKAVRDEIRLIRRIAKATPVAPGTIKTVDPIGDAPADLKISVRFERCGWRGEVRVTLSGIPDAWKIPVERYGSMTWEQSDELTAVVREIAAIAAAYNYDGSDSMTDLCDVRFHGTIQDEDGRQLETNPHLNARTR
jgi:hypothetical protein